MQIDYNTFIVGKDARHGLCGFEGDTSDYDLFPFQRDLVGWALKKGRCAIFADTGLGKTRMQVAWADQVSKHTGGVVVIMAPLAVAAQTVAEAARIGVHVTYLKEWNPLITSGIVITNYERLHKFTDAKFAGVVLDESSCIKNYTSRTLTDILDAFSSTPYRLAASATPAPNDWVELGTHAEFLGIRTRAEMLAEFFYHDSGDTKEWVLKGHARQDFWKWVASWGLMIRSPGDLGYDSIAYNLPALNEINVEIEHGLIIPEGEILGVNARTLTERRKAKRDSIEARVEKVADIVNSDSGFWVVWCNLNDESAALKRAIPGSVEIIGSMTADQKEDVLLRFARGDIRVLITKASMTGMGLNWQHCRNTIFVGLDDSYEQYYQAVRRFWRFGQTEEVNVYRVFTDAESNVVANLARKRDIAERMFDKLSEETMESVNGEIHGSVKESNTYVTNKIEVPKWL